MDTDVIFSTIFGGVAKTVFSMWPVLIFPIGYLVLKILFYLWKRNRLKKSGVSEIDYMTGKEFEIYLELLFKDLGYNVERTKYVGDYGADLVVKKDGVKTAVQAKRYKKKVGVKAVQEAVASKGYYDCDEAMVVINNLFTNQAVILAHKNNVILWDREVLVKKALLVGGNRVTHEDLKDATLQKNERQIKAPVRIIEPVKTEPVKKVSNLRCCSDCGEPVSDKVMEFCRVKATQFSGNIYCYKHQRKYLNN